VRRPHAFARQSLLTLPALAQGPVSAALGGDAPAYRVHDSQGALWASSPAAHLRSSFASSGVSISSGHAKLGLRLEGVGFGSTLAAVRSGTPTAHGNRVSYVSGAGVTQWYANGPLGLEQGFTVSRAPAHQGAAALLTANQNQGAAAPLTLAIGLSGNTKASVGPNAGTITLTKAGTHALRYTNLSATDARGRALHSWLSLRGGRILLHVDARGANYPLRIDPLLQGEVLTNGGPNPEDFAYTVALSAHGGTALVGRRGLPRRCVRVRALREHLDTAGEADRSPRRLLRIGRRAVRRRKHRARLRPHRPGGIEPGLCVHALGVHMDEECRAAASRQ
jgi:hypothetical protein